MPFGIKKDSDISKEEQAAARARLLGQSKKLKDSGSKIHIENRSPVLKEFPAGGGNLQRGKK